MYPWSICESRVRLIFALAASSDAGISSATLADRSVCVFIMAVQQHRVAAASIMKEQWNFRIRVLKLKNPRTLYARAR